MLQREFLSALVMSGVLILFFIPLSAMSGTAQLFPALLLVCMFVFNMGQYLMAYVRYQAKTEHSMSLQAYPVKRVLALFALTLLYLGCLQNVGFYPASVVFFASASLITQPTVVTPAVVLKRIAVCGLFVGFLYVLFTVFLKVQIPKGFMGF